MFPFLKRKSDEELEYAAQMGLRYPLDTSQLPRLYNLRLAKASECKCERCDDLLDNLRNRSKLLEAAHNAETPSRSLWTHVQREGTPPAQFDEELDRKMKLSPKELTQHDEFLDTLVEVENNWQRSQDNNCTSDDTFWMCHYNDIKGQIAELRRFEDTSLEELRNSALKSAAEKH